MTVRSNGVANVWLVFPNNDSRRTMPLFFLFEDYHGSKGCLLFVARLGRKAVHDRGRLQQLLVVEGGQWRVTVSVCISIL